MKIAQAHGRIASGRSPGASSWIYHPYLLLAFRLFLAAVFIYAAVQKIGKPLAFADEIHSYSVVDYGAPLYTMAVVLPWLELLCGLSLVTGVFVRGSALVLLALNAMFLVVIAKRTVSAVHGGTPFGKVYFDCGCGFGATYAWKKLFEDAIYFILSMILLFAPGHRFTLSRSRRSS
jgi:putative oxidoreductase